MGKNKEQIINKIIIKKEKGEGVMQWQRTDKKKITTEHYENARRVEKLLTN